MRSSIHKGMGCFVGVSWLIFLSLAGAAQKDAQMKSTRSGARFSVRKISQIARIRALVIPPRAKLTTNATKGTASQSPAKGATTRGRRGARLQDVASAVPQFDTARWNRIHQGVAQAEGVGSGSGSGSDVLGATGFSMTTLPIRRAQPGQARLGFSEAMQAFQSSAGVDDPTFIKSYASAQLDPETV